MIVAYLPKHPSATLDYQLSWSTWLGVDTISVSAWTVPTGITKVSDSNTTTTSTVRLSGGTDEVDYQCDNLVTLASGQIDTKSIIILARTDSTDWETALSELSEKVQIAVAPVLTLLEIQQILYRNKRAVVRANSTAYIVNQLMMPSPRNGHRFRCVVSGTSATADPYLTYRWPTTQGARVSEGTNSPTLTWVEDGPEYANIYDVRQAAHECWLLKARKASQFIQTGDLNFHQVYDHCVEEAGRVGSLSFG